MKSRVLKAPRALSEIEKNRRLSEVEVKLITIPIVAMVIRS
jgi:hypothetical protein